MKHLTHWSFKILFRIIPNNKKQTKYQWKKPQNSKNNNINVKKCGKKI